jgi:hypothetical protein
MSHTRREFVVIEEDNDYNGLQVKKVTSIIYCLQVNYVQ